MGQRDAGISRGSHGRGHTRNDVIGYAGFYQRFHLFTTSPEDKRVTAFEPGHSHTFPGLFHK